MLDSLFGAEMPLAVRFFLAFLIVLGLIGAIAWALRRFGAGRFRDSARGRQPRLAVIDHASVDGRRRLILVRRDNVEHLLMIGGPTDVVVEPNIVRAMASPRDVPGTRPAAGIEALPRAIPLPENGGSWPLQPEPATMPVSGLRPSPRLDSSPRLEPSSRLEPSPRLEPQPDEVSLRPLHPAEPPARPPRDTLAALADELGSRPVPPRRSTFARPQPAEPRVEPKAEPHGEIQAEPHMEIQAEPPSAPLITPPPPPPTPPAPPQSAPAAAEADQSLADMASRLEAALRKPSAPPEPRRPMSPPMTAPMSPSMPPMSPPRSAPPSERPHPADTLPPVPRAPRPSEPKPAPRADTKPNQGNKTALYDSLEQEMASLLGRPTKT
jgi:flagellar protein FliO/FliZ